MILNRSPIFYLLALAAWLALMAGVVSAEGGPQRERLAGTLKVERPTCAGSGPRATKLSRLCNRARISLPGGRHHGPRHPQAPAPVGAYAPSGGGTSGPAVTETVSTTPDPVPAEPQPETSAPEQPPATPEPEPTEPTPTEPPPAEPEPEPEPEPPKPEPEPEPTPPPPSSSGQPGVPEGNPSSPGSIYWGAWVGGHLTGTEAPWDMGAVAKLEQLAGKRLSLVNFSAPFANCSSSSCSFYNFPDNEFNSIRAHGSIPFYSWGSQSIPAPYGVSQPDFELSDVIAGTYDSYIRQFATAAKSWGHPFFLRFNWEMNGGWFNWSEGVNGNQQGEYVAAWRHVHDIFEEVGATNATWVWCPNVDPDNALQNLAPLYPGDAYVDWTGLDGYNWGTNPARPDRWRSFDSLYRPTYEEITKTIAPSKPLIVSEIGSTEYGGSKSAWIEDMLATVPAEYPKIRGLLWFEKYDDGMDWPIGTSASATAAFAAGVQSSAYLGNAFGSLGGTSVQPAN